MLRLTEDCWDLLKGAGDSDRGGKSEGFLRGLASWSKRVIEYALPGERANDFRGVAEKVSRSLDGMVGIKSVRRRPRYPLAQPAAMVGVPNNYKNQNTLTTSLRYAQSQLSAFRIRTFNAANAPFVNI